MNKSCDVIGYPNGQDGAVLPARKPYNKSFIDQAGSVTMAGYWPRSFFFLDYVSVHKLAKEILANIQPS